MSQIMQSTTIEAGPDALRQLRVAVDKHMQRIVNLCREWDTNQDGKVSRAEFAKAIKLLCLAAPPHVVDALFDTIDKDKNGYVEYGELHRALHNVDTYTEELRYTLGAAPSGGAGLAMRPQDETEARLTYWSSRALDLEDELHATRLELVRLQEVAKRATAASESAVAEARRAEEAARAEAEEARRRGAATVDRAYAELGRCQEAHAAADRQGDFARRSAEEATWKMADARKAQAEAEARAAEAEKRALESERREAEARKMAEEATKRAAEAEAREKETQRREAGRATASVNTMAESLAAHAKDAEVCARA